MSLYLIRLKNKKAIIKTVSSYPSSEIGETLFVTNNLLSAEIYRDVYNNNI